MEQISSSFKHSVVTEFHQKQYIYQEGSLALLRMGESAMCNTAEYVFVNKRANLLSHDSTVAAVRCSGWHRKSVSWDVRLGLDVHWLNQPEIYMIF